MWAYRGNKDMIETARSTNPWLVGGRTGWIDLLLGGDGNSLPSTRHRVALELFICALLLTVSCTVLLKLDLRTIRSLTDAVQVALPVPLLLLLVRPQFALYPILVRSFPKRPRIWLAMSSSVSALSLCVSFLLPGGMLSIESPTNLSRLSPLHEPGFILILFFVWIGFVRGHWRDIQMVRND